MIFSKTKLAIEGNCATAIDENVGVIAGGVTNKGLSSLMLQYNFKESFTDIKYWQRMPGLPDGGRYMPSCGNYKINGKTYILVLGGIRNLLNNDGIMGILEVCK